jgi:hypothetical protein
MKKEWFLFIDPPLPGVLNMSIDDFLIVAAHRGQIKKP